MKREVNPGTVLLAQYCSDLPGFPWTPLPSACPAQRPTLHGYCFLHPFQSMTGHVFPYLSWPWHLGKILVRHFSEQPKGSPDWLRLCLFGKNSTEMTCPYSTSYQGNLGDFLILSGSGFPLFPLWQWDTHTCAHKHLACGRSNNEFCSEKVCESFGHTCLEAVWLWEVLSTTDPKRTHNTVQCKNQNAVYIKHTLLSKPAFAACLLYCRATNPTSRGAPLFLFPGNNFFRPRSVQR